MEHCLFSCTEHFDLLKCWQMGISLNCYNSDKNYLCLQLWSMMVCCIEYIHRNGSIELEWVIHNSPLYQTHSHYCLYHHHNSHHQQMKDCYNLKLWNKWNLHWGNTLVLGRMYRWILSSFWGIDKQYWLISGAKRRRRPVLHLNSEEWWQYSPIYLTQNYCIHIVIMSTFVHVSF